MKPSTPQKNRLSQEKSPYLLQHADNPVHWYPWGTEAFEKAQQEDKPIFLSIGYSTCHWCHVMEEESFENPGIARILNENFVSIKVDREERPDVDQIYMSVVQAMTGSGGWPMSVFLTPQRKPFYAGTYFPPEDRWGIPGFETVLTTLAAKWKNEREELLRSADSVTQAIQQGAGAKPGRTPLGLETLSVAFRQLSSQYDPRYAGFGGAPKFPRTHTLSLLLRHWHRTRDRDCLAMVERTLDAMSRGGIYDHIGGGFHRYSVDGQWRIPHFEKMLYDQALLSKSYLEAYQATAKPDYARIAREIFEYVLRDMTGAVGAFYSAEDADSAADPAKPGEKSEGAFYLWKFDEIMALAGKERGRIFSACFGVAPEGNALHDPHGDFSGRNILFLAQDQGEAAGKMEKTPDEIAEILTGVKHLLFQERARRPRPHLDDKILTDWNGLMISSLAFGSRVLNESRYLEAARRAADFMLTTMKRDDGRLMHRYRDGDVAVEGFLEDYAFLISGLLDLYEATFDPRYLAEAKTLTRDMIRLFWDESAGGFFFTGSDAEKLIARSKEIYDGAIPSGNSVAMIVLLKAARLTMDRDFEQKGRAALEAFSGSLDRFPSGFPQALIALDFIAGPVREIVIAGDPLQDGTQAMIREVYKHFVPNKVVALRPDAKQALEDIVKLVPFMKEQVPQDGKPTAYVCKNYICTLPVTKVEDLEKLLKEQ